MSSENKGTEGLRQLEYIKKLKNIVNEKKKELSRDLKYMVTTFGCQMNERDSEKLSGILRDAGFIRSESEEDADIIVYNTCTVRDNADQRVFGRLGVLKRLKDKNPSLLICLCGCMMQEDLIVEKVRKSYPHVDLIFGTHNNFKFAELLVNVYESGDKIIDIWKETDEIVEDLPSERKFKFKSGINIMFGCNNFCSYCIVPYVRGRERSRKSEDILSEIERLTYDGVKEVMLLGQNVNSYGRGLEEDITFSELLRRVCRIDGLERVRFMTSHPKDLSDELIEVMKNEEKICKHIHLPLQSGSDKVLSDMNRHYSKEKYLGIVKKLREAMPDIAITTDIIVGYPGETHEDVNETLDVIEVAQYEGAFTFEYSKRTGTPAASREDQVPEDVVKTEFDRVLKAVQNMAAKKAGRFTGRTLKVLVEGVNDRDPSMVTGRTEQNYVVHFKGDRSLVGSITEVELTECMGFYFLGRQIG
ncbi:MAG: tRNA (N6-isopentenyl adenosine(37)-C2)-methylthiotransferase MiaB [Lachnospiraceae bacterium]|nr:tRNA (N6-isopentenyl adenosine(37)-C2)-methylthiotransferase MiaB [Lachnospiraceae bacterium]